MSTCFVTIDPLTTGGSLRRSVVIRYRGSCTEECRRIQGAEVSICKGGDKTNIFSKVIEKSIHKRTASFFNKHDIKGPSQFGFKKVHSTETALHLKEK